MSVHEQLTAALVAALAEHGPLAAVLTGVFDGAPARCALPWAQVVEPVLVDWSTKDMAGREGRVSVILRDAGERPVRLRMLAGAAEDALAAMPGAIGEGWRVVTLLPVRSRIVADGPGKWMAAGEWRVRMLREG